MLVVAKKSIVPIQVSNKIKNNNSTDLSKVAVKFDSQKPRMSLLPSLAEEAIAWGMTYGAIKYEAFNWMKGFSWTRLYDSCRRHLNAWNRGEDIDEESGLPHLALAGCCVMMLYDTTQLFPEKDDRWHGWKTFQQTKVHRQENILGKSKSKKDTKNPPVDIGKSKKRKQVKRRIRNNGK